MHERTMQFRGEGALLSNVTLSVRKVVPTLTSKTL
jgi:hypothetical protein